MNVAADLEERARTAATASSREDRAEQTKNQTKATREEHAAMRREALGQAVAAWRCACGRQRRRRRGSSSIVELVLGDQHLPRLRPLERVEVRHVLRLERRNVSFPSSTQSCSRPRRRLYGEAAARVPARVDCCRCVDRCGAPRASAARVARPRRAGTSVPPLHAERSGQSALLRQRPEDHAGPPRLHLVRASIRPA